LRLATVPGPTNQLKETSTYAQFTSPNGLTLVEISLRDVEGFKDCLSQRIVHEKQPVNDWSPFLVAHDVLRRFKTQFAYYPGSGPKGLRHPRQRYAIMNPLCDLHLLNSAAQERKDRWKPVVGDQEEVLDNHVEASLAFNETLLNEEVSLKVRIYDGAVAFRLHFGDKWMDPMGPPALDIESDTLAAGMAMWLQDDGTIHLDIGQEKGFTTLNLSTKVGKENGWKFPPMHPFVVELTEKQIYVALLESDNQDAMHIKFQAYKPIGGSLVPICGRSGPRLLHSKPPGGWCC